MFYLTQLSQIIAIQPISSIKIMRKFAFFFSYHIFKIQGAFYFYDISHLGLASLPGFESQVCLGPRILDSAGWDTLLNVPSATYIKQSQYTDIFLLTEVTGQQLGRGSHCQETLASSGSCQTPRAGEQRFSDRGWVRVCEEAQWVLGLNILKSVTPL